MFAGGKLGHAQNCVRNAIFAEYVQLHNINLLFQKPLNVVMSAVPSVNSNKRVHKHTCSYIDKHTSILSL